MRAIMLLLAVLCGAAVADDDNDFGPVYNPLTAALIAPVYNQCVDSDRWDTNIYSLNCGALCQLANLDNANGFLAVTGRINRGQAKKFKQKEGNGWFSSAFNFGNGFGKPPSPEKGHKKGKMGKKERSTVEEIATRDSSIFAGPVTVSFFSNALGIPNFRFSRVHPGNGEGAGTSFGYRILGFVLYKESNNGVSGLDSTDTIITRRLFGSSDFTGYSWSKLNIVRSPANDFSVPGQYTVTSIYGHSTLGNLLELTVEFSEQLRTGRNGRCLGPERLEHTVRLLNPFNGIVDDAIRIALVSVVDHSSRVMNYSPNLAYLTAVQIFADQDADDDSVGFFAWDRQAACDGVLLDLKAKAWGLISPYGAAVSANPFTSADEDHVFFTYSLIGAARCANLIWDPSNGVSTPETLAVEDPSGTTTGAVADANAPAPSSGASSNTGAIVGGVVGGVALIAIVIAVIIFAARRGKRTAGNSAPAGAPYKDSRSAGYDTYYGYSTLSSGSQPESASFSQA